MSDGISLFIALAAILNTVAAVALLIWMRKRRGEATTTEDTTGHVWDGDLREYNNPLPRWWLWLFVLTVIFAVAYVILYPGLGNNRGTLGWTQQRQWEAMQTEQEQRTAAILAVYRDRGSAELAHDPQALAIGRNLFANNCAACHGSDGRGARGFPNLADRDWLWGGTPEAIETTISQGRTGMMAPWSEVLGTKGVADAAAFVLSLSGRKADTGDAAAGRAQFMTYCVACHGPEGKGNQDLGAANLTDGIWLHGGTPQRIRETIANGRQSVMPAHADRLGTLRVKLLAAYVQSLGEVRVASSNR